MSYEVHFLRPKRHLFFFPLCSEHRSERASLHRPGHGGAGRFGHPAGLGRGAGDPAHPQEGPAAHRPQGSAARQKGDHQHARFADEHESDAHQQRPHVQQRRHQPQHVGQEKRHPRGARGFVRTRDGRGDGQRDVLCLSRAVQTTQQQAGVRLSAQKGRAQQIRRIYR